MRFWLLPFSLTLITTKQSCFQISAIAFYPVYANLFRVPFDAVPLRDDFSLPVDLFCRENNGIVIANPNAPTGKYLPLEDIKTILACNRNSVFMVDEAYIAFGGESSVKLIADFPNLLVIHTLSKSHSLAGLRVGYALGNKKLIAALERIKNSINSYTLDRLALKGAIEALKDEEYFLAIREKIIKTRERLASDLIKIGFQCIESKANFLFISNPQYQAADLFVKLREKASSSDISNKPRIANYLRVSIGLRMWRWTCS